MAIITERECSIAQVIAITICFIMPIAGGCSTGGLPPYPTELNLKKYEASDWVNDALDAHSEEVLIKVEDVVPARGGAYIIFVAAGRSYDLVCGNMILLGLAVSSNPDEFVELSRVETGEQVGLHRATQPFSLHELLGAKIDRRPWPIEYIETTANRHVVAAVAGVRCRSLPPGEYRIRAKMPNPLTDESQVWWFDSTWHDVKLSERP